jgi:mannose-6-phosphate isomerase-like protein (cupin superfamily)
MSREKVEQGLDLETTYLVLADGPEARRIEVGPDFWETIDEREDLAGRMVAVFRYDADWNSWEVHPDGDEIVLLLSGAVDLVLDEASGERTIALRDRTAAIVPRGVWHTANVLAPSKALHITRGEGTTHRPR